MENDIVMPEMRFKQYNGFLHKNLRYVSVAWTLTHCERQLPWRLLPILLVLRQNSRKSLSNPTTCSSGSSFCVFIITAVTPAYIGPNRAPTKRGCILFRKGCHTFQVFLQGQTRSRCILFIWGTQYKFVADNEIKTGITLS